MAVTAFWYGKAILNAFSGETSGESIAIDYLSDTINCSLHLTGYTPAQDTDEFWDAATNEHGETGTYTTHGATLGTKTLGYTGGTNVIKFSCAAIEWAASTIVSATNATIFDLKGGAHSADPLMGYILFGEAKSSSGGSFKITPHTDGLLTITPS